ncbi:hypothetical protein RBI80_28150 [Klebsiella variicola]|nr:hypothetical protein RBI80_28150 [Klebsiella variicola]
MISSLSLFSYATALWLHSEIFDLKKNMPRLHQLLIAAVVLNLVLQVSIPLGFYGFAMQIEGVIFIIITPVLLFTSWWLWRKKPSTVTLCCWVCCRRSTSPPRCWCSCLSTG